MSVQITSKEDGSMTHKPPNGYLTRSEAAKIVGCSESVITLRIQKGKIKARRFRRPKGEKGFPYLVFVREADVIEAAKEFEPRKPMKRIYTHSRTNTTNSSRRDDHAGETWQVFNGSDTPIFEGTFDECLLRKRPHETMQMIGGERNEVHPLDAGRQWGEIDRYNFHTR